VGNKVALIFGVTGQDGSFLTEYLLRKNYTVYGVSRRTSTRNDSRIEHVLTHPRLHILCADITDAHSVRRCLGTHVAGEKLIQS
jgi:GDPmannose 4,6-dehydratase